MRTMCEKNVQEMDDEISICERNFALHPIQAQLEKVRFQRCCRLLYSRAAQIRLELDLGDLYAKSGQSLLKLMRATP